MRASCSSRRAGGAGRRLQYRADRLRHLQHRVLAGQCAAPAEARDAYARLLEQGWTDALRHLHPDERIYTFYDYFRNAFARDAGLRIDHFLLSPDLVPRLQRGGVDRETRGREGASDHAPAWIELAL
jgi:exodeoxyribonuclease III